MSLVRQTVFRPCFDADHNPGELFLGQAFGGLDSGEPPSFLDDVSMQMLVGNLKWNNPWIAAALSYIPMASVQYFLGSMERLATVSCRACSSSKPFNYSN